MKNRWTIMALVMCMSIVFAGCGSGDSASESPSESESTDVTASDEDVTASDEEVSASQADVSASEEASAEEADKADGTYTDGTYEGVGEGYSGDITVAVTISGGEIYDIEISDHTDDDAYVEMAEDVIFDILDTQSTDVDVASGATFSSKGIIEAVTNALADAEK